MGLSAIHVVYLFLISSNIGLAYLFIRLARARRRIRQLQAAVQQQGAQVRHAAAPHLAQQVMKVDPGLARLANRAANRRRWQPDAPDLLPQSDVDLAALATQIIGGSDEVPANLGRRDLELHAQRLRHRARNRSELFYLNTLCIAYLRRLTPHTDKARNLFFRIWREQGDTLLAELNPRWMISVLQTFYDHAETDDQRLIGMTGFVYGNMIKIYEAERCMIGLPNDGSYQDVSAHARDMGVRGLNGCIVGESDIHINTNTLICDAALRDQTAGPVLLRLLDSIRAGQTVFSRSSAARIAFDKAMGKGRFKLNWPFNDPPEGMAP